ncbi:MAG: hypothetical protein ACLFNU_04475 [Bacteroidales bacterium]
MKSLTQNIIFSCLLFTFFNVNAQVKNIGIPSIVNHTRSTYKASTQNWSITQNEKGFIYFGNNDGILEYDGTNWNMYPVPNASVVRSVLAIGDTIYSGAFEEIGFLAPNHEGKLTYNSLNHLIPDSYSNFDEIWNIYHHNDEIIFQSFNYIFIYSNQKMKVVEPHSKFSMLHFANNTFYVVDIEKGLLKLTDDTLEFVSKHPIFFQNEIRCILPLDNGTLLIGTSNEGLFTFNQKINAINPFNTEVNKKLNEHNLFSAVKLTNGNLAFGSISNGVYLSGDYHFNADFNNVQELKKSLQKLPVKVDKKAESEICNIYESVFQHRYFTGRSGSFYKYEGLGSIYWHLVSKLLLNLGESIIDFSLNGSNDKDLEKLTDYYYRIKEGIGVHKKPENYGAFPTDPYSHTPSIMGAQQPGMTGQVKEDILSRFIELGLIIDDGKISIQPTILKNDFFINNAQPELHFTYCNTSFCYIKSKSKSIKIIWKENAAEPTIIHSNSLSKTISEQIFKRSDTIKEVIVSV